ncbi:MAG: phage capsid protein [Spirochaetaceae bacterium]
MAITIDNAFVEEYKDLVIHLAQQGENKLRSTVMTESTNGEAYNWDRLAATSAVEKTTRRADSSTFYVDDAWTRRVSSPQTFVHIMTVEHEDKVQMLVDPESSYAKNQAMAMNRSYDDLIIAAATGDATDGDGASVAFPAAQKVGDGTTVISFDMVTEVQETFMANDIDLDVPKVFIIGPTQVRKLMQLTQQTSADYVHAQALQKLYNYGIVPNWMGFTWIMSTRLLAPAAGELSCLAYTKQALGLAINQDVFTRIGENPDKAYMIQVFAQYTAGCVRVEDEQIVHVHVKDAMS